MREIAITYWSEGKKSDFCMWIMGAYGWMTPRTKIWGL